jgi:Ca-activated chloride channel homolog
MSMSRRGLILVAMSLVFTLLATWVALAQTLRIVPPPDPMPPHPVVQRLLTLTDMHVDVRVRGAVAETTVRQTLRYDGGGMAEGQYLMPLPSGATIAGFALIDGDQRLEGKVLDAAEARRTYQDIVRTMRDPGLLEYQDYNSFSISAFPFNAGQSRSIEVKFTQALSGTTDLVQYQLPLRWAGWSRCNGAQFVLSYDIDSDYDLGTISSPTYGLSVNREGDRRAHGSFEQRVDTFANDFTLNIGRRAGSFAASLLTFPGDGGEDGYFLLSLLAALPKDDAYIPKDVLFVFDKSGSMSGEKIEQARNGLKFVIDKLRPEDRFNLIYYSDNVEAAFDGLRPASSDNVREARDLASRLEADGGTDIYSALNKGAAMLGAKEHPRYVIFLTDGLPTVGDTDVNHILANAKEQFPPDTKLFAFGVGYDVNTALLDSLSYDHHGTATYITPGEDIEVKVSQFYAKMSSPALTGIKVDLSGLDVYDVMPRELPDLFHNTEIFLSGRYRGKPSASVTVSVSGQGSKGAQTLTASVASNLSQRNNSIPRLWAARKVSWLLDQVRLKGDNRELLDEIDRLATRYGIVTPYTSYLITEPSMYFDRDARNNQLSLGMQAAREEESGEGAVNRSKMSQTNQAADNAAAPQVAGQSAGGGYDNSYGAGSANGQEITFTPHTSAPQKGSANQNSAVNYVNNQTFVRQDAAEMVQWIDARFQPDSDTVIQVTAYSDAYFELLDKYPQLADYLSQSDEVTVVIGDGLALQTVNAEVKNTSGEIERINTALSQGNYL